MPRRPGNLHPVAMLWQLAWNDSRLSCAVYRAGKGFEMRLKAGTHTIFTEPFDLGPRVLARVQALRRSLKRRGWRDLAE